jgi:hypothetical protein
MAVLRMVEAIFLEYIAVRDAMFETLAEVVDDRGIA